MKSDVASRSDVAEPFRFDRERPTAELRRRLLELAEPQYRTFVGKFLPDADRVLGVRVPAIRTLAREIARSCGADFLNAVLFDAATGASSERNACRLESYEERIAVGLVVAETEIDFDARLDAIAAFVPLIDSWAVCDVFSASLKIPKSRRDEFWDLLESCAASERPYEVRFAAVGTLTHFLEKTYVGAVFERANRIAARRLGEYYVDMSLAWLVAEAFVRFPDATFNFLRNNDFDDFTFNKALQKISESRRVDDETKAEIRRLKRPRRARQADA